jgi:chromate transporter
MRPAVVALIVAPVVSLSRNLSWWKIVMAALIAVLIWHWGFSPIWFLLVGGIVGVSFVALNSRKLKKD